MKENDIWWQGVVWDQFPDRLRVYLPGARLFCCCTHEWFLCRRDLGSIRVQAGLVL